MRTYSWYWVLFGSFSRSPVQFIKDDAQAQELLMGVGKRFGGQPWPLIILYKQRSNDRGALACELHISIRDVDTLWVSGLDEYIKGPDTSIPFTSTTFLIALEKFIRTTAYKVFNTYITETYSHPFNLLEVHAVFG